ncbi:4-hydroxy-tetrahydrodipicolinate reductase [Kallotenue papyrolyticum]|uniref:4-hydroxy-tetrahydrodipicolinate reductase n=1 Tax=Kallotenue papyrolyticum TaxID=1325125 RepID=UPI0004786415|nr:4-hydroxy-tetrahydrodipicolinate reductase [Kallotenue papyrolyticum]
MTIRVCLAGATGWAGSALARAIARCDDLELVAAVGRRHAGRPLGAVLDEPRLSCTVYATAQAALAQGCDVFVEYTRPELAKTHVLAALEQGAHVVIGTSGLTDADYAEIAAAAEARRRGVLAAGNFALTAVLLQKFAELAARYLPQWEIIDYASDHKPDAPSGTVRELAARLGRIRPSALTVPLEATQGLRETRGARLHGSQVHALRLPGYTLAVEIIFGLPDQRLTIRHDAGSSAEPYVDGALLAIRKVPTFVGLRRGLDSVLDLDS